MERTISYSCHAVRNFYACKTAATIERKTTYACYTIWNYSIFTPNYKCVRFCFYYSITFLSAIILNITLCYQNAYKPFAIIKRILSYCCHTVRNFDARKACATLERKKSYCCHAISYCYIFKPFAIIKCTLSYCCYAVRNFDACKACAIMERKISYACYAVSYRYAFKSYAIFERTLFYCCHAVRYFYAYKPAAMFECILPYYCYTVCNVVIGYIFGNCDISTIFFISFCHFYFCVTKNVVINAVCAKIVVGANCCAARHQ